MVYKAAEYVCMCVLLCSTVTLYRQVVCQLENTHTPVSWLYYYVVTEDPAMGGALSIIYDRL